MTTTAIAAPPEVRYDEIFRRASLEPKARELAARYFAKASFDALRPLNEVAGMRGSDVGACSLEFAAKKAGLGTLEHDVDTQIMFDGGHFWGAWFASLLKAAAQIGEGLWPDPRPRAVLCEYDIAFKGVPGHIDALVDWAEWCVEPVEFKTLKGTGKIEAPDTKRGGRLYQCLQAGLYANGLNEMAQRIVAPRFTLVYHAPNAGKTKQGVPYRRTDQFEYETSHFTDLVEKEIARLQALANLSRDEIFARMDELADTTDGYRCGGCAFAECPRNVNPQRLII
jgi:hypothetical protein